MAAPAEVVSFLRTHAGDRSRKVTVYELAGAGTGFGGYRVASTTVAEPTLADELIARLSDDRSYASYGCRGVAPLGVRIEAGGAALSFVIDCHVRIDGTRDVAEISPEMLVFRLRLEAKTVPCEWVRLDYFDLELCVDRTMRYGGGMDPTLLSGLGCPQVVISSWQPGRKDMRRIGTVDVSCSPRNTPDCAAICDSLRPTPNSAATASFPADPPVIRSITGGGLDGHQQITTIWRDGTVVFSGTGCRKLRGGQARISPEKVTELLARLASERLDHNTRPACMDCVYTRVSTFAGDDVTQRYGEAGEIISAMVGQNPC